MRSLIIFTFILTTTVLNAQQIEVNGILYEVVDKSIHKNGVPQVAPLSDYEVTSIETALKTRIKKEKKDLTHLQKRLKLVNNITKAKSKLEKEEKKFTKLKASGDLAPNDIAKWNSKIEKLKSILNKAEQKNLALK